jgi:uncharacterized protein with GYD domain
MVPETIWDTSSRLDAGRWMRSFEQSDSGSSLIPQARGAGDSALAGALSDAPKLVRCRMFTYVGLFRVAPIAREHLEKTPEYFDKIYKIVEDEGGTVERFLAVMGPWEYLGIFEYPDLEAAFRVLGRIAKLEVFETETFPAEDVKVFWKALV